MKILRMTAFVLAAAWAATAGGFVGEAAAQEKEPPPPREGDVIIRMQGPIGLPPATVDIRGPEPGAGVAFGGSNGNFIYLSTEMSINGKLVKGAPYSAQAVSESVQTLSDGNRIVRKTTAAVYRDGEGRTRRDQTLGTIGPFAQEGDPPQTYFINDPVAGVNYILDPRSRTARKLPLPKFVERERVHGGASATPARAKIETEARARAGASSTRIASGGHGEAYVYYAAEEVKPVKESLGKQIIEGVEAEGTRTTITIPAGQIGNEQPINIVSESWFSPALQVVVMTKHSDPRMGETTYRLTGINRSEPARSLFEVPADYTVKELPSVRSFRRKVAPPNEQ
ncbi:MAG: hypothetical protein ACRD68_18220 [Pyrinomonadaceae bacterium]